MNLRDEIAGRAMQSLLAIWRGGLGAFGRGLEGLDEGQINQIAKRAYDIADAMLKASGASNVKLHRDQLRTQVLEGRGVDELIQVALEVSNGHRTDCNERKCGTCTTCRARFAVAPLRSP